jgi:hypothetical protein
MSKRNNSFLSLFGVVLGVAAGWKLRKIVQREYENIKAKPGSSQKVSDKELLNTIFGKYSQELKSYFQEVRDGIDSQVKELKLDLKSIDTAKYREIVNDVLTSLKSEYKVSKQEISQLRDYLLSDFELMTKKVKSKTSKDTKKK